MSETATGALTVTLPSELEVQLSRVVNAPRGRVFEVWTRAEDVRQWWGQKDSTMAVCEIDLRAGGAWRFVEHAADGNEYPFRGEYSEVTPPERLVHTFIFDVEPFNARPGRRDGNLRGPRRPDEGHRDDALRNNRGPRRHGAVRHGDRRRRVVRPPRRPVGAALMTDENRRNAGNRPTRVGETK